MLMMCPPTGWGARMLVHERVSRWVWASEHGWICFEIVFWCRRNIWKILLDTWDIIFGDVEEYFAMCSWMKDIQRWNFGWQMKMDERFHECWQHIFLWKTKQKKKDGKKLCWFILKNLTHEMLKSYFILV